MGYFFNRVRATGRRRGVTALLATREPAWCTVDSYCNVSSPLHSPPPRKLTEQGDQAVCVCEALSLGDRTPYSLLSTVQGRHRTRVDSEPDTTGLRTSSVNHVANLLAKREPTKCTFDSYCNVYSPLHSPPP